MENTLFINFIRKKFTAILFLILCWSLIYLPNLGLAPLSYVESQRVSIAFDIVDLSGLFSADYIGEFYSNKPPIYSFLLSIFLKFINTSIEFAARLPSALCLLFTAIISLYNLDWLKNNSNFFISLLLIVSPVSIHYGRLAEMDMIYASLIYLSFIDCLYYFDYKKNKKKLLSASILQGISFLIKGPIGILMLFVFILFKSNSLRDIIKVLKNIFPLFLIISFGYFFIPLKLGLLNSRVLILQLYVRFVQNLQIFRHLGERFIVLFYSLIPWLIAFNNKHRITENSLFIYKFCIGFIMLLFILPGFQSDYSLPILMLLIIPSGVLLSNLLNSKEYLKVFPILIVLIIFVNLYSLILPHYVSKISNLNQAKNILFNSLRDKKEPLKKISKKIFLTSITRYIAPYLYNEKDNFELSFYNKKNLKDELFKNEAKEFFLISEKNIFENKKFINSQKEICSINKISNTYIVEQIFKWPGKRNNSWRAKYNFNLYKLDKCAE